MTIFQRLEAIEPALIQVQTDIAALKAVPPSGVTSAELAALSATVANIGTQVDGLRTDVGIPTPPAA